MAKRGDTARQAVMETIQQAFGENLCGVADKKIYVMANDGAEMIQFAISITMPKSPVDFGNNSSHEIADHLSKVPTTTPTELSSADKEKVNALMEKLGLK